MPFPIPLEKFWRSFAGTPHSRRSPACQRQRPGNQLE